MWERSGGGAKPARRGSRGHGGQSLRLLQPSRHASPEVFRAGPHVLYWSFDERIGDEVFPLQAGVLQADR